MNVTFRESFAKDLGTIRDKGFLKRVAGVIEAAEEAASLTELPHVKKLKGGAGYYRIRVGGYRLGIVARGNELVFVRILDRKDIYRYFP